MKRILLIVAIVLSLSVAAAAIAYTYESADPVTGTLTTDSVIEMTLNSTASSSILLSQGEPTVYPIVCDMNASKSAPQNGVGTLTITLMDTIVFSMDEVNVTVYNDENCTSPVAGATQTGAGVITIPNISSRRTLYLRVFVPDTLTDVTGVGGTIRFAFNRVG